MVACVVKGLHVHLHKDTTSLSNHQWPCDLVIATQHCFSDCFNGHATAVLASTKHLIHFYSAGSQLKMMHNLRMIQDSPLSFCRHKQRGVAENGVGLNPERLQTSMSLYSDKLSIIVMMVDGRVNSSMGLKEGW